MGSEIVPTTTMTGARLGKEVKMKTKQVQIHYYGGDRIEKLHKAGVKRGAGIWYAIHMALADNMREYSDVADPAMMELFARAALVCVVSLQRAGHLPNVEVSRER